MSKVIRYLAIAFAVAMSVQCVAIAQIVSITHSVSLVKIGGLDGPLNFYPDAIPLPAYPTEYLRAGVEGEIRVKFRINDDGTVSDIRVMTGKQQLEEFAASAQDAMMRWKFHRTDNRKGACDAMCVLKFSIIEG